MFPCQINTRADWQAELSQLGKFLMRSQKDPVLVESMFQDIARIHCQRFAPISCLTLDLGSAADRSLAIHASALTNRCRTCKKTP